MNKVSRWRPRIVNARDAFSLLELLVVIAIIGVALGLLLSAIHGIRNAAYRAGCANNLRQLGLALSQYHDLHNKFPAAQNYLPSGIRPFRAPVYWPVLMLPFLEQDALWACTLQSCREDPWTFHNPPHTAQTAVVKTFVCLADWRLNAPITDENGVRATFTSYLGIAGSTRPDGVMGVKTGLSITGISDGASHTVIVGERPPPNSWVAGWWYAASADRNWENVHNRGPNGATRMEWPELEHQGSASMGFGPGNLNQDSDRFHFWSLHPAGGHFLFCDGAVRFFKYSGSARLLLNKLSTHSGCEVTDVGD